jgi:hypothetical protein
MENQANTEVTPEEKAAEEGARAALSVQIGALSFAGVTVITPRSGRIADLTALLKKANKRAEKLGTGELKVQILGEVRLPSGTKFVTRTACAIFGEPPRVEGHSLLARVEHTKAGNIITRSPVGQEAQCIDTTPYNDAEPVCQHCGKKRNRKDTFLLLNHETMEVSQVGRNCLADYLKSNSVKDALALWKLLYEATSGAHDWDGYGGKWEPSTLEFLACSVRATSLYGFHKSGSDHPTKYAAGFACGQRPTGKSGEEWDKLQPTEDDFIRAQTVRAWAISTTSEHDYIRNLRIACSLSSVGKHSGLLASAPAAYKRHVEKELEKAKKAAEPKPPPGNHLGEKGKRVDLPDLQVVSTSTFETDYGMKTAVTLETLDGSRVTWFAVGIRDFDAGTVLKHCRGTVKEHSEFKGRAQTVVSRLAWKIEEEHPVAC